MTMQTQGNRRGWYLDKSVNLGLIGAVIFNSCMGIWFFSKLDSRVEYLEKLAANRSEDSRQISNLEGQVTGLQVKMDTHIISLKEGVKDLKDSTHDLEKKVDMLVEKFAGRRAQ